MVWDYGGLTEYTFSYVGEYIDVIAIDNTYRVSYDGIGSILFSIIASFNSVPSEVISAMAVREYGQGRIMIHTDRVNAVQTGHGHNPADFWRKIFEWVGQRNPGEVINVGIIINKPNESADRINGFPHIIADKIKFNDLATKDISEYDLIYMVGLPNSITSNIAQKISQFVESGGGLILESPDRGGEYINVMSDIENVYVYSAQRAITGLAYWTNDGVNHYVYYPEANMTFMVAIRLSDLSSNWTVLMSNVQNINTTTTTTATVLFDLAKNSASEFAVSFVSAMQKGLVEIETE